METDCDHKIAVLVSMVVFSAGDTEFAVADRVSMDAMGGCMVTAPA
ncbi:hypothetical protein LMG31506_04329 [Cupriavidus yeoncheonensis]|uniref:Uncharacterized protein n=1 Tax=Cupriavidus yeoncheonensis TaxID=1462994 RepID=A0A916IX70_9BURK|nr:hypothetical protein LMG31506_04329 [Cupriavidus yeoncheonensis]